MLNFNASFTTNEENTVGFALAKGYQEKINQPVIVTITQPDGTQIQRPNGWELVDNPQTPKEFVCEYMKNYIAKELNSVTEQTERINAQVQAENTIKENLEVIKDGLTVDIS